MKTARQIGISFILALTLMAVTFVPGTVTADEPLPASPISTHLGTWVAGDGANAAYCAPSEMYGCIAIQIGNIALHFTWT